MTGTSTSCSPWACAGSACKTNPCTTNNDCAPSHSCDVPSGNCL
jgi:hypothetical protein